MKQFIITILAFMIIPILVRREVRLSYTIAITALVLGLFSGIGLEVFLDRLLGIFTGSSSRDTILTVLMISILGGLMRHYKILDQIVELMMKMVSNKKLILMLLPSLIGILIIPGGAILSAPFIYKLGEELDIAKPRRAAINLIFRHVAMFIFPFSSMLLFVRSSIPGIDIYRVIRLNLIFILGLLSIGYFLYIRDIEGQKTGKSENLLENISRLLVLTLPIYLPVIINMITGLDFYLTMFFSILLVYILGDKKNFLKVSYESMSWNTVLTVASVLLMKDIILEMDGLLGMIDGIFISLNNQILILFILIGVSIFFGMITGYSSMGLAVTIPIVLMMGLGERELYQYLYFLIGSGFLGYFFSPIHLCQLLTVQEMGVSTGELYKEYRPYILLAFCWLILSSLLVFLIY